MSTFKGLFGEIPGIAADRFDGECLQSKYLFLSHCHSDHMIGLQAIEQLQVPLFASAISAVFLRKQFPNIGNAIEVIDIDTPLDLTYNFDGKDVQLVVTAIPAKHCPGSVMFLFETGTSTVLYTGDFRILKCHFNKYQILKNRAIDSLYLDSTFLSDVYREFPTRIESITEICSLISEWLNARPENKVLIEMPAQYGIEFIFISIQRKLGERIHIYESQWEKYVYLPAMDSCISPDADKCRIFTSFKQNFCSRTRVESNFRVIKPTALYWSCWSRNKPFVMKVDHANEYRVAYSNHCSYSELRDFLQFTQPKRVSLNVVPKNSERTMMECLERIYKPTVELITTIERPKICFDNVFLVENAGKQTSSQVEIKFPPKRLKL